MCEQGILCCMRAWLKKIELVADKLILPALVAVFFIVVAELFFHDFASQYHSVIVVLDYVVIGVFVVDLSFKVYRASTWEGFLKNHWLEVIAILPFAMVFRVVEGIFIATDIVEISQHTAHLAEGARSGRLAELFKGSELTRSSRFASVIRAVSRTPRFAKAAKFFESPEHSSPL